MLVGLAIVIVVLLAARIVRRRFVDAADRHASVEGDTGPPTFNVVALGASGSGKTVFLASMFNELKRRRRGRSYHLVTSVGEELLLTRTFDQIRDPAKEWPEGTVPTDMRQFSFDCATRLDRGLHAVMRISYLEYSGELLDDARNHDAPQLGSLVQHAAEANALFGIIDGRYLAQFMRGAPDGLRYVHATLSPMISLMLRASCPIHFILTKWDLVRDFGEAEEADDEDRLRLVSDELLASTDIGHLVHETTHHERIVRLIPVTAVGPEFASIDDSGKVVKVPDAPLEPANLDVPLSVVVPDYFEQLEAELSEKDRERLEQRIRRAGGGIRDSLHLGLRVVGLGVRSLAPAPLLGPAIDLFIDWLAHRMSRTAHEIDRAREAAADESLSLRRARERVLDDFEKCVWGLEARLPSSLLHKG